MRVHNQLTPCLAIPVALSLVLLGCGGEPDANTELQKAVAAMEAAPPPAPASPMPAQPQYRQPIPPAQQPRPATPPPAQQMSQAMAAYQAGHLQDAVTRLQRLRATPAMNPRQRIALNDAMAAVMTEIYTLAEKGDPRAIQAVKQYERMQTQRH